MTAARRTDESFEDYKARRKDENTAPTLLRVVSGFGRVFGAYNTDNNRRTKRALVKAMGARQFKKQSRKAA